mgnify:CR=1 FL=1
MSPLVIHIGRQSDGCAYELNPRSVAVIRARYPGVRAVPSVFVGYDTRTEFEELHGPMWKQIAMMLTGLSWEQIEQMGGVSIYDPTMGESRQVA